MRSYYKPEDEMTDENDIDKVETCVLVARKMRKYVDLELLSERFGDISPYPAMMASVSEAGMMSPIPEPQTTKKEVELMRAMKFIALRAVDRYIYRRAKEIAYLTKIDYGTNEQPNLDHVAQLQKLKNIMLDVLEQFEAADIIRYVPLIREAFGEKEATPEWNNKVYRLCCATIKSGFAFAKLFTQKAKRIDEKRVDVEKYGKGFLEKLKHGIQSILPTKDDPFDIGNKYPETVDELEVKILHDYYQVEVAVRGLGMDELQNTTRKALTAMNILVHEVEKSDSSPRRKTILEASRLYKILIDAWNRLMPHDNLKERLKGLTEIDNGSLVREEENRRALDDTYEKLIGSIEAVQPVNP